MRTKSIARCLGLSAVALTGLLAGAPRAAEADEYGDGYSAGNFGRVRYIDSGATITRGEWDAAPDSGSAVNAPIFPGDAIETGQSQRAEVQLAGNHVVRIDRGTRLTFLALPDPHADVKDNAVLQLSQGRIRLTVVGGQAGEEFRIDTPSGAVYVLADADLRVEVDGGERTRVQSFRGVAEVVAEGGSVLVRSGTATEVATGLRPSDPAPFNTFALDDFDLWVNARESIYQDRSPAGTSAAAYAAVPSEVRPYYRELDAYGNWSHTNDYGYVWYPVSVGSDWRPYYHGSWGYGPSGYFWISNEPWGWAPYHYGRWISTSQGWGWVPGSVFAGAWVAWSWGPLYLGWSPIDCYDRPVYVSSVYYDYYDSQSWTFVSYRHLGRHDYAHYSVGFDDWGSSVSGAAVVTRPPHVRPGELSRSVEARERAVRTARGNQVAPPSARSVDRAKGSRPGFLQREHELRGRPAERLAATSAVTKAPPAPRFPRRLTASASSVRDTTATPRPGVVKNPRPRAEGVDHKSAPAPRPGVIKRPEPSATATGKTIETPRRGFISNRPRVTESSPARHAAPSSGATAEPQPSKPEGKAGPLHNLYMKMAQPRRTQAHGNPRPSAPAAETPQAQPRVADRSGVRPPPSHGAWRPARPQGNPQADRPAVGGGGNGSDRPASPPSRPSAKTSSPRSNPHAGRPERSSPPSPGRSGNPRRGSGRAR